MLFMIVGQLNTVSELRFSESHMTKANDGGAGVLLFTSLEISYTEKKKKVSCEI